MSATAFIEARDFLLAHRDDYERAYRDFRWPALDRFNWALDYFDPMARGNNRPGLWIVDEGGGETRLSFAELAERSSRVANHLRALGVRPRRPAPADARQCGAAVGVHAGGDEAGGGDHPGDDVAEPRRSRRPLCPRPGPPCRRRRRQRRQIRRPARRLHPDRGRRGRTRLASLGGRVRRAGAVRRRRRDPGERPAAALFHLGHHGQAEAGPAQPSELSGRASLDDVLSRRAAGRRSSERLVAGLGQARL